MQILLLLLLIYNNKVTILPFSFHAYSFVMLNFEMFQSPEPRIGRTRLLRQHLTFKLDLKQYGDSVLKQVNETVTTPQEVICISLHYNTHRRIQKYDSGTSVLMKA